MKRTRSRKVGGTRSTGTAALIDMRLTAPGDARPLTRQVGDRLKDAILSGLLKPGQAMPSTRHLAKAQGLGRNTIIAAYDQLASEGFLISDERTATLVADLGQAPRPPPANRPDDGIGSSAPADLSRRGIIMAGQGRQESVPGSNAFHPGTPDITRFPFSIWRRMLAAHLHPSGRDLFGYHSVTGHPALRRAIADYLGLSRNVVCDPDSIIVTNGAQAALDLVCRLFLDPGDHALMEEPGYPGARACLQAAGARLTPLPVSPDGWDLDQIADKPFRLAYLTPACQMPFGVTMRVEQRLRLLDMAAERRAWLVEDDFDGEFRFTGQPIPSLQGQDPHGRVIYVGSFAKTLFPALRLGYLVLPRRMLAGLDNAIAHTGQYPPLGMQAALADFMEQGFFARHVRLMRRLYGRRREQFITQIEAQLGQWLQWEPADAGIQTLWMLRSRWRDTALSRQARVLGLNPAAFSGHFWHGHGLNGLVLGYAAMGQDQSRDAILRLKTLLQQTPG